MLFRSVVVLSATSGVEVGTEKVWDYCERRSLPRMFFVSLMDKEHANFERVFNQIKDQLTPKVIPVEIPVGEGLEFHHRHPFGLGGDHSVRGIGLLCKAHNLYQAEIDYGREAIGQYRRARRQAGPRPSPQAS